MDIDFNKKTKTKLSDNQPWVILIVDDNEDVHLSTRLALKNLRFKKRAIKALSAYSGEEAMNIIDQQGNIALVLLDVVMESGYAGLKLVKHIRETLNNNVMQIILRTGKPDYAPSCEVLEEYEIDFYIEKDEQTQSILHNIVRSSLGNFSRNSHLEEILLNQKEQAERFASKQESLAKERGDFLTQIIIEMKSPLESLNELSDLLSDIDLDDEYKDILKLINKKTHSILQICNNVLTYNKLNHQQFELEESAFNLKELIDQVIAQRFLESSSPQQRIHYFLDEDIHPELVGDSIRIKQVLDNILDRVQNLNPRGKITLGIDPSNISPTKIDLAIDIQSSVGKIPEDELLFMLSKSHGKSNQSNDLPQRIDLRTTIAKGLIEVLGGRINAADYEINGFTITMHLPLKMPKLQQIKLRG